MLKRLLTLSTHRVYNLPIIVMMPHSRCNCRCVMCDIWKANHEKRELSIDLLQRQIDSFKRLGVKEIVFSGGEALMHSNLWRFCEVLNSAKIKITLLSTGVVLEKNAVDVLNNFKEVIVSLDGSEKIHDKIRNLPLAFHKLSNGVRALKRLDQSYRITGRCVLQRYNYFDFQNIVKTAEQMGLDQISFLAADVSTAAFNRNEPWTTERVSEIALTKNEVNEFEQVIKKSFIENKAAYKKKFIAESPSKMMRLVDYYKAVNGLGNYPQPVCNAPWVSAVIESNGSVMPCFFHKPYGNLYEKSFGELINATEAISFRKNLNVEEDPICRKCVCSLKLDFTKLN